MTAVESFTRWLRRAPKGDRHQYYCGLLAVDRGPEMRFDRSDLQQEVWLLAEAVNAAAGRGVVLLTQQRERPSVYRYFATKV